MGNEIRLVKKMKIILEPVIPVDYFNGYHIMQMSKIKRIVTTQVFRIQNSGTRMRGPANPFSQYSLRIPWRIEVRWYLSMTLLMVMLLSQPGWLKQSVNYWKHTCWLFWILNS